MGIAVGKVGERIVFDLNKKVEDYDSEKIKEDDSLKEYYEYYGEGRATDMPLAYSKRFDAFSLLQMDGEVSFDEVEKMLKLGKKGCDNIYDYVKNLLKKSFSS